jgi:hypothetical protein
VAIDACLMIEVHAHAKPLAGIASDDVQGKGLIAIEPVIQGAQRTPYTL